MPNSHYNLQGWGDGTGMTLYPGLKNMDEQLQGVSYRVSVKDPRFGAVGDGVTDDTAAFRAAAQFVSSQTVAEPTNAQWPNAGSERLGRAELYVPPGAYLITGANDALIYPPPTANTQGLTIRGAGRYVTQIIYKPASVGTDSYLISNSNANGWLNVHFEDIAFQGATSGCSFMLSTGPVVQNYTFTRCNWTDFRYQLRLQGTDNNSEITYDHCGFHGTFDTAFYSETSDQFLNYNFYDCQFEVLEGTWIRLLKGGNVNVIGGSLIQLSPSTVAKGTFFKLEGNSHFDGTTRFYCQGVRIEHRSANSKLLECQWDVGTVKFDSIDDTAFATAGYAATLTTASFKTIGGPLTNVAFESCRLMGRHEYGYTGGSYLYQNNVIYRSCEIRNFNEVKDFLVITNQDTNSNAGGVPVVTFEKTLSPATYSSRYLAVDSDHNWSASNSSKPKRRAVMIKQPWGKGPISPAAPTVPVTLPLNAVIIKVHFYQASGVSSTQTNWSYTLRTTDGTPVTIDSVSGGGSAQLGAGFSKHTDVYFVCDTPARRNIDLVANASVDADSTTFQCVVEYYG